jgi:hypothetical protein
VHLPIASTPDLIDHEYPKITYKVHVVTTGAFGIDVEEINSGVLSRDVAFVHRFTEDVVCEIAVTMDDGGLSNRKGTTRDVTFATYSRLKFTRLVHTGTDAAVGDDISALALNNGVPLPKSTDVDKVLVARVPTASTGAHYDYEWSYVNHVVPPTSATSNVVLPHSDAGKVLTATPTLVPQWRFLQPDPPVNAVGLAQLRKAGNAVDLSSWWDNAPLGHPKVVRELSDAEPHRDRHTTSTYMWQGYFRNRANNGVRLFQDVQFHSTARFNTYVTFNGQSVISNTNQGSVTGVSSAVIDLTTLPDFVPIVISHVENQLTSHPSYVDTFTGDTMTFTWRATFTSDYGAFSSINIADIHYITGTGYPDSETHDGVQWVRELAFNQSTTGGGAVDGPFFCLHTGAAQLGYFTSTSEYRN